MTTKISFQGACDGVTGSCHLVDTGKSRFLVDCGLYQGEAFAEDKNYKDFNFDPKSIDFLILTHAHLDHCGRIPKLVKAGFKGSIYATAPTKDFAEIIMLDSAKIIGFEAIEENHPPLYSNTDVFKAMKLFKTFDYHQKHKLASDVSITFYDAGHILGSAFVEIDIIQGKESKKIVFSGDLGNPPVPLLQPTEFLTGADAVVIESTYGNRVHESPKMRHDKLKEIFTRTINNNGVLMIPAFALERTQELLYELNHLIENREVPLVPVYVDSPLAIKATDIYKKYKNLYNQESQDLMATGDDLFYFPKLKFTMTSQQSKAINRGHGPKVIIAGSGMANGGRILFHLKKYLSQKSNQLLIIGYQAEGTLGRKILDGARSVVIDGQRINVRAGVEAIGAYSAHADQPKLIDWLRHLSRPKPGQIFLVHGEQMAKKVLQSKIKSTLGLSVVNPVCDKEYNL